MEGLLRADKQCTALLNKTFSRYSNLFFMNISPFIETKGARFKVHIGISTTRRYGDGAYITDKLKLAAQLGQKAKSRQTTVMKLPKNGISVYLLKIVKLD
jgi:hypothetical protein